ncbi:MAG: DUF5343 domain-containing protein [Gemmatimonadales bacterium]|nr:DUF5343 domain-containing protein [Gemmatimonadales bacterium]
MAKSQELSRIPPPYVPWKSFTGFLEALKKTAIPQRIDRSVMGGMSGSTKSQMLAALRFLGLIAEDGTRTESLVGLVEAVGVPDLWKQVLPDIVAEKYGDIIGSDIDLDSGTAQQLVERFRIGGKVEGSALRKAVAFYLMAQASAGVKLSPHFTVKGSRVGTASSKPRNKPPADKNGSKGGDNEPERKPAAKGMVRLPFVLPTKGECWIEIPATITGAEWGMISSYIGSWINLNG